MDILCKNFGCRLNYAELSHIASQLNKQGYALYDNANLQSIEPQIIIANTCSLTAMAHKKTVLTLKKLQQKYPESQVIVMGCAANNHPDDFADFKILKKEDCVDYVLKNFPAEFSDLQPNLFSRTRAFVKVQDGCNNFCSYCIIPYLRGREKSLSTEQILTNLQQLASEGFSEIVLTGIQIMKRGADLKNPQTLTDLLKIVLQKTTFPRIRLSSLKPNLIDDDFLEIIQNPRIGKHFHLSLQSGCDHILKAMNRHYTSQDFANKITEIRKALPDASITTDIIVGFPGESDADFQTTYEFCKKVNFAKIHVFSFSPRQGTKAADLSNQVDKTTIKERSEQLRQLSAQLEERFEKKVKSEEQEVLIEKVETGKSYGYSSNYVYYQLDTPHPIDTIIDAQGTV